MNDISTIVEGGYCIGCGACAAVAPHALKMEFNRFGQYEAKVHAPDLLTPDVETTAVRVCPFSNSGPNEDEISNSCFGAETETDSRIGAYRGLYVGHVAESNFREIGTSGGVITWVLSELLSTGKVDAVVHVVPSERDDSGALFRFGISSTIERVKGGTKSRYYPVEMSSVLQTIMRTPGNYVVVGLPCFIKSVRRLAQINEEFGDRVKFTIGLVCGHLKSRAFADYFAWDAGIKPGDLKAIDFRVKQDHGSAGHYGVSVESDRVKSSRLAKQHFGYNWGYNFFRYSACDYCDDVFSETADLSVGDAWLPGYHVDSKGNSVIVVRHPELHVMVADAVQRGRLHFDSADADLIAKSQAGGLRDRREGLSYRLMLKEQAGEAYPQKRVQPYVSGMSFRRRRIYQLRIRLREASHNYWLKALSANSLKLFKNRMRPIIMYNDLLYFNPVSFARRCVRAVLRRL